MECTIKDDVHAAGIPRSYFEDFITVDNDRSGQGQSGRFCGPGDPGSVVFDARGQAIRLLLGGQVPSQTAGYGLVTPIEYIFEDIKASSNGRVEDIRIASSCPLSPWPLRPFDAITSTSLGVYLCNFV